ncbi:MAG: hypothetical protein H7840_00460 [Alphaproteobacteria bacterium]
MESGAALTDSQRVIVSKAPEAAYKLIVNIPRLEAVAEAVLLQDKGFDGTGFPTRGPKGTEIPLHARLLKILRDLSKVTNKFNPSPAAFDELDAMRDLYDPDLLHIVREYLVLPETLQDVLGETSETPAADPAVAENSGRFVVKDVPFSLLLPGCVLVSDLELDCGHLILASGTRVTDALLERLRTLRRSRRIKEPIRIKEAVG